jgi:dUTP pyrophosphatase
MNQIKVSKIRDVKTPTRGTLGSAGIDFYVPEGFNNEIQPGEDVCIPSGIRVNVPTGHALVAFNKSGVALKKNLTVGACVVDEDYQGEIHLHLINVGTRTVYLCPGEKITQFLLVPVKYPQVSIVEDKDLFDSETERGAGGFGSTGV